MKNQNIIKPGNLVILKQGKIRFYHESSLDNDIYITNITGPLFYFKLEKLNVPGDYFYHWFLLGMKIYFLPGGKKNTLLNKIFKKVSK